MTSEQAKELANAIRKSTSTKWPDEVGEGSCKLPAGSRVCVSINSKKKDLVPRRKEIAEHIEKQSVVTALLRPFKSARAPLIDAFGKELCESKKTSKGIAKTKGLSIQEFMDKMLFTFEFLL